MSTHYYMYVSSYHYYFTRVRMYVFCVCVCTNTSSYYCIDVSSFYCFTGIRMRRNRRYALNRQHSLTKHPQNPDR
jgi:hypothetical protein